MTEAQSLAVDVLAMFAEQREYFKTRSSEQLNKCKQVESALKKRCKAIIDPPKVEPSLFPSDPTQGV